MIGLAAKHNAETLLKQAIEFKPKIVCLYEDANAAWLEGKLKKLKIKLVTGNDGLLEISRHPDAEQVIFAAVGAVGLRSIFEAIEAGKNVAVANKEPLVMAGELLMRRVKEKGVHFLPIDSEHSGLWQCLEGKQKETVSRLILTSSGGPFLKGKWSLKNVSPEKALNHPKWKMGPKITIDSATLMNKGLEVIEARWLFGLDVSDIEVLIHPEAIVHSMVEFRDGSILAQLGVTDMKLPIQYALSYPERWESGLKQIDFSKVGRLTFSRPDFDKFPALRLAIEVAKKDQTFPCVLNAANEVAVDAFLNGEIKFSKIYRVVEKVISRHRPQKNPDLDDIWKADCWAREEAKGILN